MRAIENNQYVNGSTDTDAGADCRLILRFVIFFLLIFVEVCMGHYQKMEKSVSYTIFSHPQLQLSSFSVYNTK